jgi:hypothetical protein
MTVSWRRSASGAARLDFSVEGRACAEAGALGQVVRLTPQSPQNLAAAGFNPPQTGQPLGRAAPQLLQNLLSSRTLVPQFGQFIIAFPEAQCRIKLPDIITVTPNMNDLQDPTSGFMGFCVKAVKGLWCAI